MAKYVSTKALVESAQAILDGKVSNREDFDAALLTMFDLNDRIEQLSQSAKDICMMASKLSGLTKKYAEAHPAMFDEPEKEIREGIFRAALILNGVKYALTRSRSGIKREDGNAMTKDFVASLPDDWCKVERKFDLTGVNRLKVSDKELAKHGLFRPEYREWSRIVETKEGE